LINFSNLNVGSAVPSLTIPIIESIYVNLPSLVEQKAIAEILTSLDNKMENLNKQNQTLESLIQTFFKSINPNPLINPPRKNLDSLSE
jgi:type I restriction enzyme S subunit